MRPKTSTTQQSIRQQLKFVFILRWSWKRKRLQLRLKTEDMHSFPPRLPRSRFIGRQMREESDDFDTGFTVDTCWDQMKGNFTPPSRVEVVWSSRHDEDSFRGRHLQFRHAVSNEPRVTQDVLTKTASPIDLHRFHTWRAPKELMTLCCRCFGNRLCPSTKKTPLDAVSFSCSTSSNSPDFLFFPNICWFETKTSSEVEADYFYFPFTDSIRWLYLYQGGL